MCVCVCACVSVGDGGCPIIEENIGETAQVGKQNETPNQRQDIKCVLHCVNQRGAG